jgi:hypothetical protein
MKSGALRKGQGKGLIRSKDRRGSRSDMSPPVVRKAEFRDPSVCNRCGAVYSKKTWRRGRTLPPELASIAAWVNCPGCAQAESGDEYYGRVLVEVPAGATVSADDINHRIKNVATRARSNQPERQVMSAEWNGNQLEVLTTSQKLAHRIVHELAKAFGGKPRFVWSDEDGTLFARLTVGKAAGGRKSK